MKIANEIAQTIITLLESLPKKVEKSITADWAKEFRLWAKVEKELEVPLYFAAPILNKPIQLDDAEEDHWISLDVQPDPPERAELQHSL